VRDYSILGGRNQSPGCVDLDQAPLVAWNRVPLFRFYRNPSENPSRNRPCWVDRC
jgi:hypothetical protein